VYGALQFGQCTQKTHDDVNQADANGDRESSVTARLFCSEKREERCINFAE
jgi:hypothetical protein